MRQQFNVRIAEELKQAVAKDRKECGSTNDIVAEVALQRFFMMYKPNARKGFYHTHARKPYGKLAQAGA